jgi:TPR repeat protein
MNMHMQRIILGVLLFFIGTLSAWGGFEEAIDAFRRGDYATAQREWQPLAEQGYARAQFNLGTLYDNGWGVPQDDTRAVKWYLKAAMQGEARAQYNLAQIYQNGESLLQNYAEAANWYRKAAEQGMFPAHYNLGVMYYKGQGVSKDYVLAHMWFDLAGAYGMSEASKLRDQLAKEMPAEQIARAQKMAQEWKKKYQTQVQY